MVCVASRGGWRASRAGLACRELLDRLAQATKRRLGGQRGPKVAQHLVRHIDGHRRRQAPAALGPLGRRTGDRTGARR
jgi:hypothetical protein